ncbi:hypothetical protein PMAYCL1PPCAC_15556, partial [Pristionchus mayeri]
SSSPVLASQESVDRLTELVLSLHTKLDKYGASLGSVVSPSLSLPSSSLSPVVRAIADSEKIKDKSQRAVLVGSAEKATPLETAKHDESVLKDIVAATKGKGLQEAYDAGQIKFKRFPENKEPSRRIIKYSLPSSDLRDRLLHGLRTVGKPACFEPSMYVRRDLMPTELEQEKNARDEARRRNLEANCLKWGVRDCSLIQFRGPNYRPLPTNYRNRSLDDTKLQRKLDILALSETWLSSSDCDAYLLRGLRDYFVFRADRIDSRGGAVLIYTRSTLLPVLVSSLIIPGYECTTIDIYSSSSSPAKNTLRIVTVYRSPSAPLSSNAPFLNYL